MKDNLILLNFWAEILALGFAVIGFFMGIVFRNSWYLYLSAALIGFACGILIYQFRKFRLFPYFLITCGFLLGFLLGSFFASWILILFSFGIGYYAGYGLYNKGVLPFFKG